MNDQTLKNITSPFFRLEQLEEGVFAAISTDPLWTLGNAGIVDLGDQVIIFDDFATPRAAKDLQAAAKTLAPEAVMWVVNSHWHQDHFFGNQVFDAAGFISTTKTRELIERHRVQVEKELSELPKTIYTTRQHLESEVDNHKGRALREQLSKFEHDLQIYRELQWVTPGVTFDSKLILHGTQRTAVIMTYGGGHTESDAFLWLPEEAILFSADLVVIQTHPWMGHGFPVQWKKILDQLGELAPQIIVPGHGPVGDLREITEVQNYMSDMVEIVWHGIEDKRPKDQLFKEAQIPERYRTWADSYVFGWNVFTLYDKLENWKQDVAD